MGWNIQHIFLTPPIMGVTVNTVFLSPAFRFYFYVFIGISLFVGTIVYLRKKSSSLASALKKSTFACFFASGLVYAVHADMGWTTWLITDLRSYGGLTTEEKLLRMEDGLYDFVRYARLVIHDDFTTTIQASDNYLSLRAQYFLLPLRRKEGASHVIVLADDLAKFDPVKHTLTRGNSITQNVEPVLLYAKNAYILKKK